MVFIALLALLGLFGALFVALIVDCSYLGLALVLLVQLVAQMFGLENGLVGNVHFGLGDGVGVALMLAGVLRFLSRKEQLGVTSLLLAGYVALVVFSVARGIAAFGVRTAGNEAREFFFVSACMVYFSTFSPSKKRIEEYFRVYLTFAGLLVLTALARLAGLLPETADPEQRLLPAMGAYSLCLAFLICLCWSYYSQAPRYTKWLAPIYAGMAIALQHRTVWVVMVGMVAAVFKMERSLLRRALPYMLVAAVLVAIVGFTVHGDQSNARFYESATDTNTLMWRVEGWMDLLGNKEQTFVTYLVGQPFGSGYERYLNGTVVGVAAHDDYVAEFLRVGCAGLIIFLLILIRPLRALYSRRRILGEVYPHPIFWVLFLLTVLLWNFTYNLTYDQAAFAGMTASIMVYLGERSEARKEFAFQREMNLPKFILD
jgi:hypothetical protein